MGIGGSVTTSNENLKRSSKPSTPPTSAKKPSTPPTSAKKPSTPPTSATVQKVSVPTQMATKKNARPPTLGDCVFKISSTVTAVNEQNEVTEKSMAEILLHTENRDDVREPDTPVTKKAQPKATPKFGAPDKNKKRPDMLDSHLVGNNVFNNDSIITPHTYAQLHKRSAAGESPRKAPVAVQVLKMLRSSWDDASQTFKHYKKLPDTFVDDIMDLCGEASKIFESEPVLLEVPSNVFVIGDVHGNYGDLVYFFQHLILFGDITLTPHSFLCLGDYVDRGAYSLECVLYCFCLKVLSPQTFFMLRGNHEDPGINGDVDTYGEDCFQSQCKRCLGETDGLSVWNAVNGVFKLIPLAARVAGRIFCSHGGIPRYFGPPEDDDRMKLLTDPKFPRFRSLFEPLDLKLMEKELLERFWVIAFDLMWSDPSDDDSELNQYGFGRNDRGNCIITFGTSAVDTFLCKNSLDLMFRAHQEKSDGLKLSKSAKCLTVFSTSNYQGHGNGAGVAFVSDKGTVRLIMKQSTENA